MYIIAKIEAPYINMTINVYIYIYVNASVHVYDVSRKSLKSPPTNEDAFLQIKKNNETRAKQSAWIYEDSFLH